MRLDLAQYLSEAGDPLLSRVTDLTLIDPDAGGPASPVLYATNRYDGQIWAFDLTSPSPNLISSTPHLRPDTAGAIAELYALPTTLAP